MTQKGKIRSDERLVAGLLAKPTIAGAAREAGMSVRTAQRRMADLEFQQKFREAKLQLVRATTRRLTSNAVRAAEVLRRVFDNPKSSSAARVTAARATIELTYAGFETEELDRRITELERQKPHGSL